MSNGKRKIKCTMEEINELLLAESLRRMASFRNKKKKKKHADMIQPKESNCVMKMEPHVSR